MAYDIIDDDMEAVEEDVVGDNKVPRSSNACCSDPVGIRRACI